MPVMRKVTAGLGITLVSHQVRSPSDLSMAFDAVVTERSDAMIVDGDPLLVSHRRNIVEFARARRLPAVYALRDFADVGGLVAYGASIFEIWRRAAS
jgi:putative ABC transport system substrate-binding protein